MSDGVGLLIIALLVLGTAFFDYRDGKTVSAAYGTVAGSLLAVLAGLLIGGVTL